MIQIGVFFVIGEVTEVRNFIHCQEILHPWTLTKQIFEFINPSTAIMGSVGDRIVKFVEQKVLQPIQNAFNSGISPEKASLAIAIGVSCGIFPVSPFDQLF